MRVAIAGFCLESVSFLPVETSLADFRRTEVAGAALIDKFRGTNTVCGGFIGACEASGMAMVPLVHAEGGAMGPSSDEAFIHYADRICAGLAEQGPFDGVLLNLHGALTTPTRLDPDREIVERVRAVVGRAVPLVVALDYHANLDAAWCAVADAVFGYRYSPHIDMGETGARAGRCLARMLRGEIRPTMAVARPDVMVPSIFSATSLAPLSGLVADAIAATAEAPRWRDVSLFAGFSYADVPNCGFSVVALTDGDPAGAARLAQGLADRVRAARGALAHGELVTSLDDGIARALGRAPGAGRPIVLLEHADRMNDSTHVLRALVARGARRVAVPYHWDPVSAAAAGAAGEGARLRLAVGGRSSPRAGGPVELEARVLFAGDKTYKVTGLMGRGNTVRLGPTALIDANGIVISLTSAPKSAIDLDCFGQFGLDPMDFDIVVLRSKTHFRAAWEPVAEEILIVDTPDWGPADLTTLPYRHVPTDRVFPFFRGND
ncbi:MAG: M81 family metallopeptidase [Alphaproteobacteria bacterium]